MQLKKGENRVVLIIGDLVIKIPLIHMLVAGKIFWDELKRGLVDLLKKEFFEMTIEQRGAIKCHLFKGIVDNWREFLFYRRYKHQFTQPTYFSLLGLINFQRTGQKCQLKEVDLWCQLFDLTEGEVFEDEHTFANPANFCICNGQLRILDYANAGTQKVIVEYSDKILEQFDMNYSREERKRLKKRSI